MNKPEIKCIKTKKCGWIGTNSDLVPIKKNSFSSDLTCPKCGGKTFYPIDENGKIKRLQTCTN